MSTSSRSPGLADYLDKADMAGIDLIFVGDRLR